MTSIEQDYREAYNKHCNTKMKHVLLYQVSKCYHIYSFDDLDTDIETLANTLSLYINKKEKKQHVQIQISEKNLRKHFTTLYDNGYTFVIYDMDKNSTSERNYIGSFNENLKFTFDSEKIEEGENNIFCLIIHKNSSGRFDIYSVYLDINAGTFYYDGFEESSIDNIFQQFFAKSLRIKQCLIYVKVEKDDIEEIKNKVSMYNYEVQKIDFKEEIDDLIKESFSNEVSCSEIYFRRCIYYILKYLKQMNPSKCKNFYFDDNHYSKAMDITYMKKNQDLLDELYVHHNRKEDRSRHSKCKSLFDLLCKNMNAMSKRELTRRLDSPFTKPEDIKKSHKNIKDSDEKLCDEFKNFPDFERFFYRMENNQIDRKIIAEKLIDFRKLMPYYEKIKDIFNFIDGYINLDNLYKEEDFFLQTYSEEIEEKINFLEFINKRISAYINGQNINFVRETFTFEIINKKQNTDLIWMIKNNPHKPNSEGDIVMIPNPKQNKYIFEKKSITKEKDQYMNYMKDVNEFQDNQFIQFLNTFFEYHRKNIRKLISQIAEDGMNSALKRFFKNHDYILPTVKERSDFSFHKIIAGRHPICEENFKNVYFTPFDSELNQETNGTIIYGCNTVGKSTYLKMVGIQLYLAQCGFYVPCKNMEFYPYQQIFSQFAHRDNLFEQKSLYQADLSNIESFYKRCTEDSSLLLIDEFLHSSDIQSCLALFLAYIKHFQKKDIKFLISSHYHQIAEPIQKGFKRIQVKSIRKKEPTETKYNSVNYQDDFSDREMVDGPVQSNYGLESAKEIGITQSVLDDAQEHINRISIQYHMPNSRTSRYNSQKDHEKCERCGIYYNLDSHHVFPQKNFDDKNRIQGFLKDGKYNLQTLCKDCHRKITYNN